jgi:hypothetical protein
MFSLTSICTLSSFTIRNLEDLHFFSDNIWNLGMGLTAGK